MLPDYHRRSRPGEPDGDTEPRHTHGGAGGRNRRNLQEAHRNGDHPLSQRDRFPFHHRRNCHHRRQRCQSDNYRGHAGRRGHRETFQLLSDGRHDLQNRATGAYPLGV